MTYAPFKPPFRYDDQKGRIFDALNQWVFTVGPTVRLMDRWNLKSCTADAYQSAIGHRVAQLMTKDATAAQAAPATPPESP